MASICRNVYITFRYNEAGNNASSYLQWKYYEPS